MDYNTMRHLADSWGLVYLFVIFVGVVYFTFRRGSKDQAAINARIPLKKDDFNGEE